MATQSLPQVFTHHHVKAQSSDRKKSIACIDYPGSVTSMAGCRVQDLRGGRRITDEQKLGQFPLVTAYSARDIAGWHRLGAITFWHSHGVQRD